MPGTRFTSESDSRVQHSRDACATQVVGGRKGGPAWGSGADAGVRLTKKPNTGKNACTTDRMRVIQNLHADYYVLCDRLAAAGAGGFAERADAEGCAADGESAGARAEGDDRERERDCIRGRVI